LFDLEWCLDSRHQPHGGSQDVGSPLAVAAGRGVLRLGFLESNPAMWQRAPRRLIDLCLLFFLAPCAFIMYRYFILLRDNDQRNKYDE